MKFRFAVELDTSVVTNPEQAERLLRYVIEEGLMAYGHTTETLPFKIVKLRSRSTSEMLKDKP